MKSLFATLRLLAGLAGLVAVGATFFDTASRGPINPFNFFGFFTLQSNIITAIVFIIAALATFAHKPQTPVLVLARACVTTYIVIVGLVYNTLLVGLPGGVELEWANFVLHVAMPIYAAIDWVFFGDRRRVAWKRFGIVLIYPLVWVAVVLVRGATDGWVPYPFLSPTLGYGVVSLYVVGIAAAIAGVGAGVWWLSRIRILKP
jgi:hypothetical protein